MGREEKREEEGGKEGRGRDEKREEGGRKRGEREGGRREALKSMENPIAQDVTGYIFVLKFCIKVFMYHIHENM